MAQKSLYTQKMADDICDWLSQGKTLTEFCRITKGVSFSSVYRWLDEHPDFAANYARARDTGHDVIAEDCLAIADQMPPPDANGRMDSGFVAWQKNRIWTRERLLKAWNPKKYGDAKQIEVSGPNGGPIKTQATVVDPATMDEAARDALRYALTAVSQTVSTNDQPFEDDEDEGEE